MNLSLHKYKLHDVTLFVVMSALLYFVLFLKLNAFPMRPWDEVIYANSAFEMTKSGKLFTLLNHGVPDMYNDKPLLPIWLQAISIRLLGFNELAVRLPSAIAAAATALGIFFFIRRNFNLTWAVSAFFVLLTTAGFIHFHASRTGDMDALLTAFMTFGFLSFVQLLIDEQPQRKSMFALPLFFGLAFATKLFAVLLFLPAIFFVLLFYRKMGSLLRSRHFYAGTVLALLIAFVPLYIRNLQQPGYFEHIFQSNAGRVTADNSGHAEHFDFYFNNLFRTRYATWLVAAFIGFLLLVRSTDLRIRRVGVAVISCVAIYLLVTSISVTKLEWYDVPLFPLLAIAAGFTMHQLIGLLNLDSLSPLGMQGMLLLVFSVPVYYAYKKSHDNNRPIGDRSVEELNTYLFETYNRGENLDQYALVQNWHRSNIDFYKHKFEARGQHLLYVPYADSLKPGQHALVSGDSLCGRVRDLFVVTEKNAFGKVNAFEILGYKTNHQRIAYDLH